MLFQLSLSHRMDFCPFAFALGAGAWGGRVGKGDQKEAVPLLTAWLPPAGTGTDRQRSAASAHPFPQL